MDEYSYDVVFLDNDLYLTNIICQNVNQYGFRATTFDDWYEAIRILRKNKTKILIFNEICYNINMVDYIKFARTNLPETRLYLSLEKDIDAIEKDIYYEKKINGIIIKPFSTYDVINLIKNM